MPSEFAGTPLSCELGQEKESKFLSVPLHVHVKVAEAVPIFRKYIKFTMKLHDVKVSKIIEACFCSSLFSQVASVSSPMESPCPLCNAATILLSSHVEAVKTPGKGFTRKCI